MSDLTDRIDLDADARNIYCAFRDCLKPKVTTLNPAWFKKIGVEATSFLPLCGVHKNMVELRYFKATK